ncbi:MAG: peptidase domain-containing ABC transporter [Pseudomonadota bacterium]
MSVASSQEGDVRALSARLSQAFKTAPRLALKSSDGLGEALRHGGFGGFEASSSYAACLMPLLKALDWRGSLRELAESLPHFANDLDLEDLRNVLAYLGFASHATRCRLAEIDPRLLPCLRLDVSGAMVVLGRADDGWRLFDGASRQERVIADDGAGGDYLLITRIEEENSGRKPQSTRWTSDLLRRFRRTLTLLFAATFALNLLSLVVPLYIMAIYDQVIPAQSRMVLAYLAAGVAIALVIELALRALRARLAAHLGGRVENILATSTFRQLLSLSPPATENATVGAQAARLREFDSIRDLFTGPLVSIGLELPFVILFLAVIALIAGPIAYIPIAMIGLYGAVGGFLLPGLKRSVAASSRSRAARHGFLVEMLTNVRTIKQLAAEPLWTARYRDMSAAASFAHFHTAQMSFLLQTLAQAIMMGAGVATIAFGVARVVDGAMSVGALIATMALVWRVLAPLQSLFLTLTRFEQIKLSLRQINHLMTLPVERRETATHRLARRFAGEVAFDRVSLRYRPDADPALLGVGFTLAAGGALAIMGGNGAGKSTVLNIIAGLYRPQAGLVTIDGVDIRQIDPIELRQTIAYVPQEVELFHGTIAQNLRLGQPTASDAALAEACQQVGILAQIQSLPEGFATRIGDQRMQQLNYGFRQGLAIARALLRQSPILLLDEAARSLDEEGDRAFIALLKALKGKTTVIMVSHRPSHVRLCDQVLVLDNALMRGLGAPDEMLAALHGSAP